MRTAAAGAARKEHGLASRAAPVPITLGTALLATRLLCGELRLPHASGGRLIPMAHSLGRDHSHGMGKSKPELASLIGRRCASLPRCAWVMTRSRSILGFQANTIRPLAGCSNRKRDREPIDQEALDEIGSSPGSIRSAETERAELIIEGEIDSVCVRSRGGRQTATAPFRTERASVSPTLIVSVA